LRLITDIDLHEAAGAAIQLVHRFGKSAGQRSTVQRMDAVEQADRFLRLVRLQLPDEMQLDPAMLLQKRQPLRLRFLNPVLSERALPGCDERRNRFCRIGLGNGDQLDVLGVTARKAGGLADRAAHIVEPFFG
jgi:hypothetical protein